MSLLLWRKLHHGSSAVAADAYAVGGNAPEFVADFAGTLNSGTEYYRSGGSDTTFSSVFTHSGLVAPATMTDSDGSLKWAPHNFIYNSEDISTWSNFRSTDASNVTTDPLGGSTADSVTEDNTASATHGMFFNNGTAGIVGEKYKVGVYLKAGTRTHACIGFVSSVDTTDSNSDLVYVDLSNGTKGDDNTASSNGTVTSVGSGWYLVQCEVTCNDSVSFDPAVYISTGTTTGDVTFSGDSSTYANGIYVWGWHLYLSGLGGMVDNTDQSAGFETYIPTTTAARFLPRRNHHIYNGTSWENAGILIEPAAATNLVTYSNDLTNASGWSIGNTDSLTVTNAQSTGADGSSSLALVEITDTTDESHFILSAVDVVPNNANAVLSMDVKYNSEVRYITFGFGHTAGSDHYVLATYDLVDNVFTKTGVGANSGTLVGTYKQEIAPDIWRISVAGLINTAGLRRAVIGVSNSATPTYNVSVRPESFSGTAGHGFFVGNIQAEAGSVPTSYIPTAGSTVTRAAETLTIGASIVPDTPTALCAQVSGYQTYDSSGFDIVNLCGTSVVFGDAFMIRFGNSAGDSFANFYGGQVTAQSVWEPVAGGINRSFNFAARHSASEIQIASGGTAGATANPTNMSTFTGNSFVFRTTANSKYGGTTLSMLRWWETDIGESGIEEAST